VYGIGIIRKERMLTDGDKVVEVEEEPESYGSLKESNFMSMPMKELDRRKAAARVGFVSMDLYEPPSEATWGRYNDRKVNHMWVMQLVEDFKREYGNCSEKDSIELAIKPEWLKNLDEVPKAIDGLGIEEVPQMEFTEEGLAAISPDNLVMLGGNHRRKAVHIYVDWLKSQIQVEEKRLKTKESEGADGVRALSAKIKEMKEEMDLSCFWAVQIYDLGEWQS
jgi:hypothetical protein